MWVIGLSDWCSDEFTWRSGWLVRGVASGREVAGGRAALWCQAMQGGLAGFADCGLLIVVCGVA